MPSYDIYASVIDKFNLDFVKFTSTCTHFKFNCLQEKLVMLAEVMKNPRLLNNYIMDNWGWFIGFMMWIIYDVCECNIKTIILNLVLHFELKKIKPFIPFNLSQRWYYTLKVKAWK